MKVIASIGAPAPDVEIDEFVFLNISWAPPSGGLLYRFASPSGVIIAECCVDATSGALYSCTVQNLPQSEGDPLLLICDSSVPGLPVVDRFPWQLNPDNQPETRFVEDRDFRTLVREPEGLVVQLRQSAVIRWLLADPVAFGLSEDCELVALRICTGT
jgi:hypothetical protein